MASASALVTMSPRPGLLSRGIASPLCWWVFLVLGVAIRFRQYLFVHSYWYDESFLVLAVRDRGFAALLGPQPFNLVIPPFFLWTLRGLYELGGDGELLMRLPAFLAGIGALFLIIPLARKLIGTPHAIWAFVLLAVSRSIVLHSCEVRPYTVDLLMTEVLLYGAVTLLDPEASWSMRRWAVGLLCFAAAVGPWFSFPCIFVLGAVSLALAVDFWQRSSRRLWSFWVLFNGIVCLSGLTLWWFAARHMYYSGMIEHWGHKGWGGFPDWSKPTAIFTWVLSRPLEIGKYGTKELGPLVALLAMVGGWSFARRSRALTVLLAAPFILATMAALLGKYPLADRTVIFLLPCLWLLAAAGIGEVVGWAIQRGWELAYLGLLVVAFDLIWLGKRLIQPESMIDFRGVYQFVHSEMQPGDRIWDQMGVVYETYYGKDPTVWPGNEFAAAVIGAGKGRLWMICAPDREDLRQAVEAAGRRLILQREFSKQKVWLFEPRETENAVPAEHPAAE